MTRLKVAIEFQHHATPFKKTCLVPKKLTHRGRFNPAHTKAICRKQAFKMVRGPEEQQVGLLRSGMSFQELSKLKLQVTLESNLLN